MVAYRRPGSSRPCSVTPRPGTRSFFFCLSGFVVTYSYDSRLSEGMTTSNFMVRRLIRLYPMVLIAVPLGGVLMFGHALLTGVGSEGEVVLLTLASLMFIPLGLVFGLQAYPPDNPVWTLFFELSANLCYAVLGRFTRARCRPVLVLMIFLGLALLLAIFRAGSVDPIGFSGYENFLFGFLRVAYPFLVGLLICRAGIFFSQAPSGTAPVIATLLGLLRCLST